MCIQSIILLEAFALYRSRKPGVHQSQQFVALYKSVRATLVKCFDCTLNLAASARSRYPLRRYKVLRRRPSEKTQSAAPRCSTSQMGRQRSSAKTPTRSFHPRHPAQHPLPKGSLQHLSSTTRTQSARFLLARALGHNRPIHMAQAPLSKTTPTFPRPKPFRTIRPSMPSNTHPAAPPHAHSSSKQRHHAPRSSPSWLHPSPQSPRRGRRVLALRSQNRRSGFLE